MMILKVADVLSLGFMPQTSLSVGPQPQPLHLPENLSLGFMPQTSLSGEENACYAKKTLLSLGFMPQTSLSVQCVAPGIPAKFPVSGVHAPDFVERSIVKAGRRAPLACLWGSCPRLR